MGKSGTKHSFVPSEVEGRWHGTMQFWVYILRCSDGSYYTGHTDDLDYRLSQHHQGLGCEWTRWRRPVELVWHDITDSRYNALVFERQVKRWSRAKKEALIAGDWTRVGYFATPPHEQPSIEDFLASGRKRTALTSEVRPSTSLGTNEVGDCPPTPPASGRGDRP